MSTDPNDDKDKKAKKDQNDKKESKGGKDHKYNKDGNAPNTNIVGFHKRFSQTLGMWDTLARGRMRSVFGDFIKDNPDPYGVDFLITDPNCRFTQLEIQVVTQWKDGQEYPYDNITIFERKGRYDNKTLFCSLNRHLTECYFFFLSDEDRKDPVPLYPESKEYVYNISRSNCTRFYLHTVDGKMITRLYPKRKY